MKNWLKKIKNKLINLIETYKKYLNSEITYKDFNKKKGKEERIKKLNDILEIKENNISNYIYNENNFLRSKAGINFRSYTNKLDLSTKEFDFYSLIESDKEKLFINH